MVGNREIGKYDSSLITHHSLPITHHPSHITNDWPRFRKTREMIQAIEEGRFPNKAMITVHPQRWTNNAVAWGKELVWQNVKNAVKYIVVQKNGLGV